MSFVFAPMPHEEARQRIAGMPLVTRDVFDGLLPELKAYAFTVTGVDAFDQLARIREELAAVPAGTRTWQEAKETIAADLSERLGGKEAERRAELLLRTHTFRGYAVARYRSLMEQVDVFPYWQYKTHGDGRVRPSHAALNGKILPAGHPVWQKIFPPWDWGCRCLVVPMSGREVGRMAEAEKDKVPEARRVWDGAEADAIHAGDRLPGGISILPSQTWGSSPWSVPGTVQHTWQLVQERYGHDPAVLDAFRDWAQKTEIPDLGKTVSEWLGDAPAPRPTPGPQPSPTPTPKPRKKRVPKPTPTPPPAPVQPPAPVPAAPRTVQDVGDAVMALKNTRDAAQAVENNARLSLGSIQADYAAKRNLWQSAALSDDDWNAYVQEHNRRKNEASDKLMQAVADKQAVIEQARDKVAVPAAERGTLAYKPGTVLKGKLGKTVKAWGAVVERFVHRDLLPLIGVQPYRGRCKCGWDGTIFVSSSTPVSVVAHEITHAIEMQRPAVLDDAVAFLQHRAKGRPAQSLRKLTKSSGYQANEIAFEDEFAQKGGSHYCGKDYRGHATELLTMGIERLYRDPIEFAANDREYFDFVVRTLQKL